MQDERCRWQGLEVEYFTLFPASRIVTEYMSERFFSATPVTADRVTLAGPEAHHLLHVMRATAGDPVTLFDGSGDEFQAIVDTLHRAEVDLRIVARHKIGRELPFVLVVGVALPKGDRQKWLVEKLTELGVSGVVPLITERSQAQPDANSLERLRRSVIEASKQCGRNRLMQITEPRRLTDWVASDWPDWSRSPEDSMLVGRRLIAHRVGPALRDIETQQCAPYADQIAIGPEGGFTDAELAAALAAGWQKVSLGPRTLRVETAAIALAVALSVQ